MEVAFIVVVAVLIAFVLGRKYGSKKANAGTIPNFTDFNRKIEDKDAWEGSFWEASNPKKLAVQLEIEYVDANKSKTRRAVLVREFDNDLHGGIIIGHCQMREDTRTFRFDRIKKCVDMETGEIILNVKKYLNELYENSPEKSVEVLANDYFDVLKVVYFVAKADGQYRKTEKEVITQYVRGLVKDRRITLSMVDEILKEMDVPTMRGFKLAFGRVIKGGRVDPVSLRSCCQEIVRTQKSLRPMEKEALSYIDRKLLTFQSSTTDKMDK